jgi:hypothetical protein
VRTNLSIALKSNSGYVKVYDHSYVSLMTPFGAGYEFNFILHSSTLKQRNRRLKTAEMEFMRRTAEYSLLDHRRKERYFRRI